MEMVFYGAFGEAKAFCNVFVTSSSGGQRRYLMLTVG
jgi:hypothetical protein